MVTQQSSEGEKVERLTAAEEITDEVILETESTASETDKSPKDTQHVGTQPVPSLSIADSLQLVLHYTMTSVVNKH